ncbi:class I SAM-dependent methyltransferase [Blastococcus sp. CT_GayMR16]|uniref:class I SAM-dependent methyltransferase n=1 Tax=Blastococcus sp. CT_GayMR16 TaxID=2559607 RepID=UPI001073C60D|nr:class I SAM-dependent methyltransferase [Blastococcus sp. CT_GayMR16]TFV87790.1 class I SAM-dependent methyltransferase [Blastococcus sp. CT_GayMR16]
MTATSGHRTDESQRPAVLGDSALQSRTLESLASAVNYHDWLTALTFPHLGEHPLELGSGLGDYALRWLDLGVPRLTLTEADPERLGRLEEQFADEDRVDVRFLDVRQPEPASHSAFVMVNVLEHIVDDVGALRAAHTLVRPGGTVVVLVPAFPFALSRFDRAVGHVRRYTVRSLTRVLTEAGLTPAYVRYVNLPGLPAWFLGMRLLRMTPGEGRWVSLWDRYVVPRARRWESRHRPAFGQSVLAVARVAGR